MSELKIGPLRPGTEFKEPVNVAPPGEGFTPSYPPDFGPAFESTPKTPPPPKVNQKNPPRPVKDTLKPLGQNKKLRSPVRKLTREAPNGETKSDFEMLVSWYLRLSKMTAMFHPKLSAALEVQAEDCADAWFDLAEKNDTIRRWILGSVEGGAWFKVAAAHTPILLAVLPEATLERFLLKGMGLFARNVEQQTGEPMFPNWVQAEAEG